MTLSLWQRTKSWIARLLRREVAPGHFESHAKFAWHGWRFDWDATPGEHELCCRATDSAGNSQPPTGAWNHGGYCNNAVQRVPVMV